MKSVNVILFWLLLTKSILKERSTAEYNLNQTSKWILLNSGLS